MPSHPLTSRRPARAALCLLAALALAAAAIGLRTSASAQAPAIRTLTFTELEKGSTFKHIRNTRTRVSRANLLGDLDVFTNPLADGTGRKVGRLHVGCVTTVGSSNFEKSTLTCSGVMALGDGSLMLQANTSPGTATTTGAVTGGTGAYANARGTFTSVAGRSGSADTITLVP